MDRDDLDMVAEALGRILTDAPLETIDHAAGQGDEARALWANIAENGYTRLCASDEHGGFGGSFADGAALVSLAARHALAAPLGDTVLAVGLMSACGIEAPEMRIGLADPLDAAAPIAHAAQVDAVLLLEGGQLRLEAVEADDLAPISGYEDGAAQRIRRPDTAIAEGAAANWLTPEVFHSLAALMRAASMTGAMQAILDLTLGYTSEREQFGRPLAKFQAIQHHLSDIACETAASFAAVELASDALTADPHFGGEGGTAVLDEIAIAKIRCGEAAAKVAAASHQAHGAMGFTREYALGRYTRRLWQWQDEFGSETEWAIRLGRGVLEAESPALWPRISAPV